ncbi:MAG: hypothetical protein P4L35_10890 [Ignavibacteriaceae bacterium]|nr:hypothetical protein [Ignavibacteriaceae bacterium]
MVYTTTQLITSAFNASGVVSKEFATVTGEQLSDGLTWLNNIISEKTVDNSMIPYETTYNFNAVIGQEIYFIANLISVDTLTFFLNSIRYSMQFTKRNQYFGSNRATNINSLPFVWYFERVYGGANLYIYFNPSQTFAMEIHGVFRLPDAVLGQDLSLTLDEFYTTYLHFALAQRICFEYSYDVPQGVQQGLGKYEAFINKKSKVIDLSMKKSSTLQPITGVSYEWANLGRGFMPY